MMFKLSDEQHILVTTVRRFIDEHLAPLEEQVDQDGVLAPEDARDVFEKSRTLGLYATNIPEAFGGGEGIDVRNEEELEAAMIKASAHKGPGPLLIEVHVDPWDASEAFKLMSEVLRSH